MGERPGPVILPGGDLVIPGDPEVLGVLVLALRSFRTSSPRIRAAAGSQLAAAQEALVRSHVRAAAARPAPAGAARAAPTAAVPGPAQAPPSSGASTITTAGAEDLTGLSAERWRQLAASGAIPGCQTHRKVWLLDRAAVIAYSERRRQRGASASKAPGRLEGEGTGTGSRGGPAAA